MPKINLEGRSSTPGVDIRHVETAFDPEARQAQQDWLDYLKQRPYLDDEGNIRDPETNAIISVDTTDDGNQAYYDQIARETLNNTSREGLGILSLARLAREARLNGDRTMLNDILDEVEGKLVEMEGEYGWNADSSTTHLDRIMSIIYDDDVENRTSSDDGSAEASAPDNADNDPAGSNEDSPEGLSQYDLMLQEKYLNDKFDEADKDIASAAEDDIEPQPKPQPAGSPNTANTANATGGRPIEQPGKTEGELEGRIKELEDQFADAKLAVETSLLKRLGGKKKRQKLEEIEQKLRKAYAEKWTMENGEFTDGAIQQCAYDMLVALDDVDKKVADKLKDRENNRGWLRRAAAAIGGWFAKGKPRTFMSGMGVGIATSLAGVWPLTTGVGLVATLGVKLSAKAHYLAERAKADHAKKTEDEQRRAAQNLVGSIETAAKSNETEQDRRERVVAALAGAALKDSIKSSLNKRDDLVKEVRKTAGVFGAGFLTGGLVGHAAQNLNLLSSGSDQMAGKVEAATASTGDQGSVMDGFRGMKEEMINRVHEAQAGAAKMDAVDSMKEAMIAQAQEARDAIANAANINILPTDFSNYDFPWDWAVEKFGEADAGPMLERLSEIAADNGHKVQWFGDGANRWVEVDGTSTTKEVLEVLGRYTGRL